MTSSPNTPKIKKPEKALNVQDVSSGLTGLSHSPEICVDVGVADRMYHWPSFGPSVAVNFVSATFAWLMLQPARLHNSATTSSQ